MVIWLDDTINTEENTLIREVYQMEMLKSLVVLVGRFIFSDGLAFCCELFLVAMIEGLYP